MSIPTPPTRKLLSSWTVKIKAASACAVLLAAGAWLAPPEQSTLVPSQERAAPLLEEQVMQRAVPQPFRGVQDAVERLTITGVPVRTGPAPVARTVSDFRQPRPAPPRGFGVIVAPTFLLTHELALDGARDADVMQPGGAATATVAAFDPPTGLVLMRLSTPATRAAVVSTALPAAGALTLAAATVDGRDVAEPVFITALAADGLRISAVGRLAPGMPIFNLDGDLVAVAADASAAWPVREALERLMQRTDAGAVASLGISYQAIGAGLDQQLGTAGVLVVRTVPQGPAAAAGIAEGDVITAIGGAAIAAAADAATVIAQLAVGEPVAVTVMRNRKARTVTVTPADAYAVSALAQAPPSDGRPHAGELFTAEALGAAGVPPAARVISLNGRDAVSLAQAKRELARSRREVMALFEHDGDRFFAALPIGR